LRRHSGLIVQVGGEDKLGFWHQWAGGALRRQTKGGWHFCHPPPK
jgi:hypothetical protein